MTPTFDDGMCLLAGAGALAAIVYMQAPQTRNQLRGADSTCYSARVSQPVSARLSQPGGAGGAGGALEAVGDTSALDSVLNGIPAKAGAVPLTVPEFSTNSSMLGASSLNSLLLPSTKVSGNPGAFMFSGAPDFSTEAAEDDPDAPVDMDAIWTSA